MPVVYLLISRSAIAFSDLMIERIFNEIDTDKSGTLDFPISTQCCRSLLSHTTLRKAQPSILSIK
ncbi:hypothetical protein DPMN_181274 [Dreissena polymorpha]|uniref:EF-hand domain-containing protein n=1 Tax=Dreissena polymorpha TaxID=45954 RepID=A0A9D4DEZ5_DREPO|nr:hypothetical protein DPMN_181274 [Dreissena polymorpha]